MKLIDMKNDPEEMKEESAPSALAEAPAYPYGLRVTLNDDSLEKLGIMTLPAIGKRMMMTCIVEVRNTGAYKTSDGAESNMELQIVGLSLDAAPTEGDAASKLYAGAADND